MLSVTSDIASAKRRIRQLIRRQRREEPPEARERRRALLAAQAPVIRSLTGSAVAAFQPTTLEPDICGLLNELRAQGCAVLLPRVVGPHLEWVPSMTEIRPWPRGIPTPIGPGVGLGTEPLVSTGAGVVLMPALAVDPDSGVRLGSGSGYYDRLLADPTHGRLLVAVVRPSELRTLPREEHDVSVDAVLTEDGLRRIGSATGAAPT